MLNIEFLENSWFFQIKTLEAWEVLFDEWDIDNNLYIIKEWELSIEKYTTTDRTETKILAKLWNSEIFWEWSLWDSAPKQVRIKATKKTTLLEIEAKNSFEEFLLKHTKKWVDLLSSIIYISNKRLLEANFLITSSYKINKHISEINEFNNKNLFEILDELEKTINWKYVLYLEKNPVLENILILKYDSRHKWKMQENIIDLWDGILDMDDLRKDWIKLSKHNLIEELKNRNEIIWYLVIWDDKKVFDEWQKKSIWAISVSIAWYIKQKQYFDENKNKEYAKYKKD